MKARICVDARMLMPGGVGVSTYAYGLLSALTVEGDRPFLLTDGGIRWSTARKTVAAFRPWAVRADRVEDGFVVPDLFREAQARFRRVNRLRRLHFPGASGVMHWTYPVPIHVEGWRNVYTIHDAIPLLQPALTPIASEHHRRLLCALLEAGGEFVSVTRSAAADIEDALQLSAGSVVNLGQAVVPFGEGGALPPGLQRGCYFLTYGTLEPRKNHVRLAAAHEAAKTPYPLVIAGPDGWNAAGVNKALQQHAEVRRIPYVGSRADLGALVAGARAVLFPSLAEGFGLPIIEAMALGTPVMTSNIGATAEVAGGAALLVDPASDYALRAGIASLASDRRLHARLSQLGIARARDFSRDAFAGRLSAFHGRDA